jgi:hypothetical protein
MVSILALSAVNRECDPPLDQNKDIKLIFAASSLSSTQHTGIRKRLNLWEVMIMCQNGRTCLHVDFCFQ